MLRMKILSLFTAFAMLLSFAPTFAYAAGGEPEAAYQPEESTEAVYQLQEAAGEVQYQSAADGEWVAGSLKDAAANVYEGGTIEVLSDIVLTESITISKSLTITSSDINNPCTISHSINDNNVVEGYGMIFNVESGEINLENITLDGGSASGIIVYHPIIYVSGNDSTLTLGNGSVIQDNHSEADLGRIGGGAVCLRGGNLIMEEGSIITNCYCAKGGGVEVNGNDVKATFTMNGGSIENCQAKSGGGVYVNAGTFHLMGGEIKNNKVIGADLSTGGGGGVYVSGAGSAARGVATIEGGSITGNSCSDTNGGGVFVNDAWAMLGVRDGVISGNSANIGAGIACLKGNILLYGGEIIENTAANYAGGVYCAPLGYSYATISGDPKVMENAPDNFYLDGGEINEKTDITTQVRIINGLGDDACLNMSRWTHPNDTTWPGKLTFIPYDDGTNQYTITKSDLEKIHSDDEEYGFVLYKNTIQMVLLVDVTLDKTELTLEGVQPHTETLTATVTPENALVKDVIWTSNDETIAVVDENGVVTPVSNGECTITATPVSPHRSTASCKVTIDFENTVTFDANGGKWSDGETIKTSDITYNSTLLDSKPEDPTRTGCKFKGWFTKPEGGAEVTEDTAVTENPTVYAQWTDNTAKGLTVRFDKHEDNARIYDIVVVPIDDTEEIHRLSSAELKFVLEMLDEGAIGYEITPDTGVNMLEKDGAIEFNFDGITAPDESGEAPGAGVKIGEVQFDGYGRFSFACVSYDDAKVNTAKLADNIVNTYTPGGDGITAGKLLLNDKEENKDVAILTTEFKPDTEKLIINIAYPNKIDNQDANYQDMTLTISGGHLSDDIVIRLGENSELPEGTAVTFDAVNSSYEVIVDGKLWRNVLYSIKLEGAGYRTTHHTVMMTEGKTLNFWNNVKDKAEFIEAGKAASEVTKNFLAGDIVDDKKINIYDLSAVVSYFGTAADVSKASEYAKYDLNRDGVIDSKDVAYVLVSWGE